MLPNGKFVWPWQTLCWQPTGVDISHDLVLQLYVFKEFWGCLYCCTGSWRRVRYYRLYNAQRQAISTSVPQKVRKIGTDCSFIRSKLLIAKENSRDPHFTFPDFGQLERYRAILQIHDKHHESLVQKSDEQTLDKQHQKPSRSIHRHRTRQPHKWQASKSKKHRTDHSIR